jgi:hypothetical protein
VGFIYTNSVETEKPQVIKSETVLEHLEGVARWVRTEGEVKQSAAEKKAEKEAAEAQAAAADALAAEEKAKADADEAKRLEDEAAAAASK